MHESAYYTNLLIQSLEIVMASIHFFLFIHLKCLKDNNYSHAHLSTCNILITMSKRWLIFYSLTY